MSEGLLPASSYKRRPLYRLCSKDFNLCQMQHKVRVYSKAIDPSYSTVASVVDPDPVGLAGYITDWLPGSRSLIQDSGFRIRDPDSCIFVSAH
jgi:hypothetical protein